MSALHHAKTEQRGSSFSHKPHSQHDDSSYSATDDSDDDNLPLASKGRVSLTTRMAITRAAQQSRPRGNVQTSSRSGANKIPHDSKFSRPLPAIRKGGTSDKTKNKKKTNSKKRDKDGPLDGSGVDGAKTAAVEINNNDLQPSHDNEPPSDGVMGDKADDEGVSMNVVTGNNSNKKRRSNRKKKDNAEGLGGNEILAMADVGNGGDNANRKTTNNAKELGCNEVHAAMDGGNGGIDAPVNIFSIFTDEEVDGINQARNIKVYDDTQKTLQNHDNFQNWKIGKEAELFNTALTNRANTYNLNSTYDNFSIDPTTGGPIYYKNPKALQKVGKEPDRQKILLDSYAELKKNLGPDQKVDLDFLKMYMGMSPSANTDITNAQLEMQKRELEMLVLII